MTRRQWLGLALGLVGVFLVLAGKIATDAPIGAMLRLASSLLLAITAGTLYQKKFCPSFDLRTGSVIQFLPTAAITAMAIALFGEFRIEMGATVRLCARLAGTGAFARRDQPAQPADPLPAARSTSPACSSDATDDGRDRLGTFR